MKRILILFSFIFLGDKAYSKDSLTVYFFLLDECRICQEMTLEINAIYNEYAPKRIGFLGLFPNFASKPEGIDKFKKKYKILIPTKTDYYKKQSQKLGAEILPTAIVYNETRQKIEYSGAINDLYYKPGKRRQQASNHYLRDALKSLDLGKSPEIKSTQAVGCFINFNDNLSNLPSK